MYGLEGGGVPATFFVLYMIGWKPHESQVRQSVIMIIIIIIIIWRGCTVIDGKVLKWSSVGHLKIKMVKSAMVLAPLNQITILVNTPERASCSGGTCGK